jgi:hypothetical protein
MSYCPFCGVFAETPHKTQEVCIDALNVEIVRMRELLDQVRSRAISGPGPVLKQILDDDPTSAAEDGQESTRGQTAL